MKKQTVPKKVKLVVQPTHPWVKITLVVVILLSIAALVALSWFHQTIQAQTDKLRDQVAAAEYANSELDSRIQDPDSMENVQKIARDELGLVDPDSIVLIPQEETQSSN